VNPNVKAKLTAPDGLAARLRQIRRAAGLTGVELASQFGWQQSKVSRIETGEQMPSSGDVRDWAAGCDASDQLGNLLAQRDDVERDQATWRRRTRRGLAAIQADVNDLVKQSTVIRHFETAVVPGLLQTWDYAYWVARDAVRLHGPSDVGEPETMADARLERSGYVQDLSKRFEFLLAEPVVRWLPCPPEVMLAQLDRLVSVSLLPNVRMGVIPLGTRIDTAAQNSFVVYDDLVRVETFVGEDEYRGEIATTYAAVLDLLWQEAVDGDEARRLIIQAADDLRRRPGASDG
jgi:transcriptional regulator with XRE-family HTH domain